MNSVGWAFSEKNEIRRSTQGSHSMNMKMAALFNTGILWVHCERVTADPPEIGLYDAIYYHKGG